MFTRSTTESQLDAEIIAILKKMSELQKDSKEYADLLDRVTKLHKLKTEESPRPKRISPDTMLIVAANIFGILWLARYERNNVITAPNAMRNVIRAR